MGHKVQPPTSKVYLTLQTSQIKTIPDNLTKKPLITGLRSVTITIPSLSTNTSNSEDTGLTLLRPLHEYAEGALVIGPEGAEFPTLPSDNIEHANWIPSRSSSSMYAEGSSSLVIGLKGARFVTPAPPPADNLAQLHRHAEQEIERRSGLAASYSGEPNWRGQGVGGDGGGENFLRRCQDVYLPIK